MRNFQTSTDQTGEKVRFAFPPQRIVSLVPSQTELLLDLGLAGRLVGRTKFCIHPEAAVKHVQAVGGTKNLRSDLIKAIEPDLIIGNKEENDKEQIEDLRRQFPVWLTDIVTVADALKTVHDFGTLIGDGDRSIAMAADISKELAAVKGIFTGKVLYLIWQNPWMAAGSYTFINSMLEWLGFENVVAQSRYPEINRLDSLASTADYVFLSSEPYPFRQKHVREFQNFLPASRIHLVDGEMFSWYGSRLLKSTAYFGDFQKLLH